MNVTVRITGLEETINRLNEYKSSLDRKAAEAVKRLAEMGYEVAYQIMAGHVYSGETINSLTVVENDPTHYTIMAGSTALLFFEFGAGTMGIGHPLAGEFGMGAGTYPGQTHAFDPNGWWFLKDGKGWMHSYGNPPHMPFYNASQRIKDDLEKVVREVFST